MNNQRSLEGCWGSTGEMWGVRVNLGNLFDQKEL